MIAGLFASVFGAVLIAAWLGLIIFLISLAIRLVKAVEKIADRLEAQSPRQGTDQ